MSLDPHMKLLVDRMAALGSPPDYRSMGAEAAQRLSDPNTERLGTGPKVAKVEDYTIDVASGSIPVRLYIPGDDIRGLMVYLHGGGWVLGTIASYDPMLRRLARASGSAILSVGYRRAPQHPFPTPLLDCYAALVWASEHMLGLLGERVPLVVAGDSAGGNLAAASALLARDRCGPPLSAQLLIYPITDCDFTRDSYSEHGSGYLLTAEAMKWFWDQYTSDPAERESPLASPLRAEDHRGLPPAMVHTARFDPLLDEGEAYAERLAAAGVPVRLRQWSALCHGFAQMAMILDPAGAAVDEIGRGLADFLTSTTESAGGERAAAAV